MEIVFMQRIKSFFIQSSLSTSVFFLEDEELSDLISSLSDCFPAAIQAAIASASFLFDMDFYLVVIIAADLKIPVSTFTEPLSKKEE